MYIATPLLLLVNLVILKINDIYAVGQFYTSAANKTYFIDVDEKFNWYDAQIQCSKMNMKLVEMQTEVKFFDVYAVLKDLKNSLWIGGIGTQIPNQKFVWLSTGEAFTFTKLLEKNPDFIDSKEFCVELFKKGNWICMDNDCFYKFNDFQLNNNMCEKRNGFVCEYKKETEIQNNLKREKDNHLQEKLDLLHQHHTQLKVIEENNSEIIIKMINEMTRQNNIREELENRLQEQTDNFKELGKKMKELLQEKHKSVYEISELENYINKLCAEYKSKNHEDIY